MPTVDVKAVAGRIARISPRGEMIPHDRFVTVEHTSYMHRLIHVHGDVEVKPDDQDEMFDAAEVGTKASTRKPPKEKE